MGYGQASPDRPEDLRCTSHERLGRPDDEPRTYGWAFDPDARAAHHRIALYRDGRLQRTAYAAGSSPDADAHYGLTGGHGYSWSVTAPAGPHRYCVTFRNLYSGTANVLRCASVTVPATA